MSAAAPSPSRVPADRCAETVLESLDPAIECSLWRGTELSCGEQRTVSTGFEGLDAELPGRGWPLGAVTEILQPQATLAEWRLLGPGLRQLATAERPLWLVGAPHAPYCPGLRLAGLPETHLIRVRVDIPAERLWATEQAVKADGLGAVLAWLPQVRPAQIHRLQACAAQADMPIFLMRPELALRDASAAPLRLVVSLGDAWTLHVQIAKRRGPVHEGQLSLPAVSPQLARLAAARLQSMGHSFMESHRVASAATASPYPALVTDHAVAE
ncbi:translesion DNA synthesis-associated protein ImuA [Eleftheria terrae]|uniref:translesion DNA synthesis-associated protein ImuA n=1 Tax=Eleftheria terrae TaxID=1597781 RepID=UPI00263ACAC3|nr:translesion DNA synthesis-associated protein ImuA [Eleftheria terrae]WKB54397.1 translesion DNA synthesis-associated protein ImuA [Eleftheria terrae]